MPDAGCDIKSIHFGSSKKEHLDTEESELHMIKADENRTNIRYSLSPYR
jgi:hypothetical protein